LFVLHVTTALALIYLVTKLIIYVTGKHACPSLTNTGQYNMIDCMQRHVYFCQRNARECFVQDSGVFVFC